ncbi:MAG TPA: N(4)-(beta-N-acetylglucosaminyl)-L-asparaginase [Petrotogaceae bacterium]|jgi:N4-(beta-N-acetylglucosaminyl)-L-asparaginase|nr:N(4)-(beta-N-acetylglucosaminyl)-L-asparaginase [Petrotogaceae bacterium]
MKWGVIATWRMALDGIKKAELMLGQGDSIFDSLQQIITEVEDCPDYTSVGYGALPNEKGIIELDAAFMDGTTLSFGAVSGIVNFKNPVKIARKLMDERFNIFLSGQGAQEYARINGFEEKNMMTESSYAIWQKKLLEKKDTLKPYDGHDTVGAVGIDTSSHMAAATSTSGLFMKKTGRIGDSPLPGCGLYSDSNIGSAAATGLGEDIMKGCICYETVRLMESGLSPQDAAKRAVENFNKKLIEKQGQAGDISVVCMNKDAQWGAATNTSHFSFVTATYSEKPTVYILSFRDGKQILLPATDEWIRNNKE